MFACLKNKIQSPHFIPVIITVIEKAAKRIKAENHKTNNHIEDVSDGFPDLASVSAGD